MKLPGSLEAGRKARLFPSVCRQRKVQDKGGVWFPDILLRLNVLLDDFQRSPAHGETKIAVGPVTRKPDATPSELLAQQPPEDRIRKQAG